MLISIANGFGFIRVPKTASTSIATALMGHCQVCYGQGKGDARFKHMPYRRVEKYIFPFLMAENIDIASISFFAVIREPTSWVRSWYNFRTRDAIKDRTTYTGNISFDEFLEEMISSNPRPFANISNQSHYIKAIDGSLGVDHLIPYDRLNQSVPKFLESFGLSIEIPRKNISPVPTNTMEFTDIQKNKVYSIMQSDVEYYNTSLQSAKFLLHSK